MEIKHIFNKRNSLTARAFICLVCEAAVLAVTVAFCALFAGCSSRPHDVKKANRLPAIYPDYTGVTIPAGIAPLDFGMSDGSDAVDVTVAGSKGGSMHASGSDADFDIDEWHELTERNRGGKLTVSVVARRNGTWYAYNSFNIYVSSHGLSDKGLTYRLIAPGYEVYGHMGIYERSLADFDERAVFDNNAVPGACVNCHTANRTNPQQFTFHVRGDHGATFIHYDGKDELLKAKNDSLHGSMVYPYWHPSGRYCAYSTNDTHQSFHATAKERIEVFDQSSDVFVYEPATHTLHLDTLLMTKDHYETYPVFSPDGKWLYFCSAEARQIPAGYKDIKYNICRIAFNAGTGTFGNRVDTVFNARVMGKSATHPRPSYDGRWLMFTMSSYGCFPIWHSEADNWLLDLRTGKAAPMTTANSSSTDSWHNWSADSHWFVFTSRRDDGLYTRLYIASVDSHGRVTKPFMLPQRHPQEYYANLMYSYNTPDFTSAAVKLDMRRTAAEIMSDRRVTTAVK